MSTLEDLSHPRRKIYRCDVKLTDLPRHHHVDRDTCWAWFTQYVTLAGVPWRCSIRRISGGIPDDDVIQLAVHCHCDSRAFFMIRTQVTCRIIHVADENQSIISSGDPEFDWKRKTHEFRRFAVYDVINDVTNGFRNVETGMITVEFDICVTHAVSASLAPPTFGDDVEFNDFALQTNKRKFSVAYDILSQRIRKHRRLCAGSHQGVLDVRRWKNLVIHELLKLVYMYQDDINVRNVESSLQIAKRYGAYEVVQLLEKYLLRTTQMHPVDKLVLASRYHLEHVLNVNIRAVDSRATHDKYVQTMPAYSTLPDDILAQINSELENPPLRPEDVPDGIIDFPLDRMPNEGEIGKGSEWYTVGKLRIRLLIEQKPRGDRSGYCIGIPVSHREVEYYAARIRFSVDFANEENPDNFLCYPYARFFDSNNSRANIWIADRPEFRNQPVRIRIRIRIDYFQDEFMTPRRTQFRKRNRTSDAVLIVENSIFHVTKSILASASPVFGAIFRGTYDDPLSYFRLRGVPKEHFEIGLQHIYHGARAVTAESFEPLLHFTRRFRCDRLTEELDLYAVRVLRSSENWILGSAKAQLFTNFLLTNTYKLHGARGLQELAREHINFDVTLPRRIHPHLALREEPMEPNVLDNGANQLLQPQIGNQDIFNVAPRRNDVAFFNALRAFQEMNAFDQLHGNPVNFWF